MEVSFGADLRVIIHRCNGAFDWVCCSIGAGIAGTRRKRLVQFFCL